MRIAFGCFRSIFLRKLREKTRKTLSLNRLSNFLRFTVFLDSIRNSNCIMMFIEDFPFNPLIKDAFIAFVALSIVLDLFYRIVWAPKVVREKKDYELFVYSYVSPSLSHDAFTQLFTQQHNHTAHSQAASS